MTSILQPFCTFAKVSPSMSEHTNTQYRKPLKLILALFKIQIVQKLSLKPYINLCFV